MANGAGAGVGGVVRGAVASVAARRRARELRAGYEAREVALVRGAEEFLTLVERTGAVVEGIEGQIGVLERALEVARREGWERGAFVAAGMRGVLVRGVGVREEEVADRLGVEVGEVRRMLAFVKASGKGGSAAGSAAGAGDGAGAGAGAGAGRGRAGGGGRGRGRRAGGGDGLSAGTGSGGVVAGDGPVAADGPGPGPAAGSGAQREAGGGGSAGSGSTVAAVPRSGPGSAVPGGGSGAGGAVAAAPGAGPGAAGPAAPGMGPGSGRADGVREER